MDYYVLWLISLEITNLQKLKLLKKYKNEKNIYENFQTILDNDLTLRKKINLKNIDERINILKKNIKENKFGVITINSEEYPENLKMIHEPPYFLFFKGDISLLKKDSLAIVGGRKHTVYGERVTRFIAKEAAKSDICIVSGGAKGIDSIAHIEALNNNGKTIAVLGCGINVIYPKINKNLFQRIEEKGLIISEFLPFDSPLAYNFPRRNRIISGLCNKLIVTEANNKSGSLITVSHALDQGKDIGVVPSSIFSELGYGCNMLIKDGADVIISRESLLNFLEISELNIKNNNHIIQNDILNIIRDEPIHIDQIFEKSQVDRNTLYRLLFEMQIKNEVVSLPGNYYARII